MELKELEQEEKRLMELLDANRKSQRVIHTQIFLSKYGINIGDTVEFEDGREKVVGVLDRLEYSGVLVNYPMIRLFNSDGKLGKREKRCWWSSFETLKLSANPLPLTK